jgi:hypothetical protein
MPTGILRLQKRGTGSRIQGLLFLVFFVARIAFAAGDFCAVCKREIHSAVYTQEDKVSHTKCFLCADCLALPDNCYLCSMPVLKDFTTLPDGRVVCKRDVSAVIVDDQQASRICEKVKEDLDRQFFRFIAFPETNVTVQLMDRIRLQELYKIIGNDYSCPNTLGCTDTKTNHGQRFFEISILSGQPRENLATTCVHEYAHTWIIENVPPARAKKIGKDAVEGFCELLSYLYAEQQGWAAGKSNILANHYTRGQIHLFIAAHRQYGFEDVVDWMKSGDEPLLLRDDLRSVRRLEDRPKTEIAATNTPPVSVVAATTKPPPNLPEQLVLLGIIWSKTQPMALINGRTFSLNEEAKVPVSSGTVVVRCVAIRKDAVVVQVGGADELRTLTFNRR